MRAGFTKFVDRTIFLEQTHPLHKNAPIGWRGSINSKKREMLAMQFRPLVKRYFADQELARLALDKDATADDKIATWALKKHGSLEKAVAELKKAKEQIRVAFKKQDRIVKRLVEQHEYVKRNYRQAEDYIGNIVHMLNTDFFVIDIRLYSAIYGLEHKRKSK